MQKAMPFFMTDFVLFACVAAWVASIVMAVARREFSASQRRHPASVS
jgi:hypothetical protein